MDDDEEHDVVWEGAAPAGGNIPRMEKETSTSRTFASAGTYSYHCSRHGEPGSVVVKTAQASNPVFTSLTLSPSSGSVQVGGTLQLAATPRDQNGAAMAGLPAAVYTTSDAARATVSASGLVTGVAAGTATITATLASGGTTRTATASITVTTTAPPPPPPPPPPTSNVTVTTPGTSFSPQTVTIAPGGSVTWQISGARHNVTFSGAAPTGGNIPDTESGSVTRTFPNAGTYDYQCTRHNGMTGRVVVQ
jgi:plastocyanin